MRHSVEPHVSLAHTKYFYDRDWAGAEREYKKAIELNPNYSVAHHWYAIYLSVIGRESEAPAEIRRAQELIRLSLSINAWRRFLSWQVSTIRLSNNCARPWSWIQTSCWRISGSATSTRKKGCMPKLSPSLNKC